jgi:hypothetical protein
MTTKVYNIKTDFSSNNAYGDGIKVNNAVLTIPTSSNNKLLTASTALWSTTPNAEVGKIVGFATADSGAPFFGSTITASTSTTITLADSFTGTALVASTKSVEWGHMDAPAFAAFQTAALAWEAAHPGDLIQLDIPAGRYLYTLSTPLSSCNFIGIKKLNVIMYGGAIFSNCNGNLVSATGFGTKTLTQDNLRSTRVATVARGATSVFVVPNASLPNATTIANAVNIFEVGRWACLAGIDLEIYGWPVNSGFIDYVLISGKNTTTGEISFATTPLQHYYKSTWPLYNTSSAGDNGGPATLYAMDAEWDVEHTYTDITLDTPNAYSNAPGRSITFINPTFINPSLSSPFMGSTTCGVFASGSQSWTLIGGNLGIFSMEVDKWTQQFTMQDVNSPTASLNLFTGSNMENMLIDNCNLYQIVGSARNVVIRDSTINHLWQTPTSYGRCESITVTNSVIADFVDGSMTFFGLSSEGINNISGASMTSGVIAIPNSYIHSYDGGGAWICEGNWMAWCRKDTVTAFAPYFRITDLTQDATYTYIHTTWPSGFPSSLPGTGVLGLRLHPCPDFTCTDCAGVAPVTSDDGSLIYALSQAPDHIPLTSYNRGTITQAGGFAFRHIIGYIKKINITVNTAAVDASFVTTLNLRPSVLGFVNASNVATSYPYLIDLETASGTARSLIVPSGASYPIVWTGAQSGDTLPNLTEALWWSGDYVLKSIDSHTGTPWSVTVELQTNQGVDIGRHFTCTFA